MIFLLTSSFGFGIVLVQTQKKVKNVLKKHSQKFSKKCKFLLTSSSEFDILLVHTRKSGVE